jgi:tetratricopeptide (TPR) repeat protein
MKRVAELGRKGYARYYHGEFSMAIPLLLRALEISEQALGSDHIDIAERLDAPAITFDRLGQYEKALPLYQRALLIRENVLGPEHADTAFSLINMAILHKNHGLYLKAVPLYQRVLEIREKVLGPEHPDTVVTLNFLASTFEKLGQYEKAVLLYQRVLTINEAVLGPKHRTTAWTMNCLAILYQSLGQYDKALSLFEHALTICHSYFGSDHYATNQCETNLAVLYHTLGQYDKALPLSSGLFQYALELNRQGEYSKAFELFQCDLAIRDNGPEHVDTAFTLYHLALTYVFLDQPRQAVPLLQRALAIREKALVETADPIARSNLDLHIVMTVEELAKVHRMLGQYDKSLHSITAHWSSRKKNSA